MCERLGVLREALGRVAAGFDAAVRPVDAAQVVADAAAIEKMAATVKALAARWLEPGRGERSAAHRLARVTGTSVGAARETLEVGRRLAARAGRVSLAELREECGRARAAARPDLEERRRRIQAARRLRGYTDAEGVWHLAAAGNPEEGAKIMAGLAPLSEELFQAARAEGRREPLEAYAFDALVALAQGAVGKGKGGGGSKVIARVDLDSLLRGYPVEGETCELVGYGPVAVSAVWDLLDTGDPFLAAVVTRGEALLGVAHLGRRARAAQRTALEWLYPSCAVEGCAAQAHLQTDHRLDWSQTHYTVLDLLDRLCCHHHNLKTRDNWGLVEGRGKRAFVPPDDPRHPNHKAQPAATGPPP
jgi:hypothetical protein